MFVKYTDTFHRIDNMSNIMDECKKRKIDDIAANIQSPVLPTERREQRPTGEQVISTLRQKMFQLKSINAAHDQVTDLCETIIMMESMIYKNPLISPEQQIESVGHRICALKLIGAEKNKVLSACQELEQLESKTGKKLDPLLEQQIEIACS